ncbi:hypothetical protein Tsubulata_040168 [Turnera subulata]|uniref:RRM domain-containing protein n=1 Tax=Turnera subulata TaxID=218843 RepID=A0A9Q0J2C9_9ROSI|nr:hypothetical protein Tsubulata_040168 [Turnera subulata]
MDIHRIMAKYGDVMDVYVPTKKNRQGKIFCFVRFRGVNDIQGLVNAVNRVTVEEGTVRANVARTRIQTTQPRHFQPKRVGPEVALTNKSYAAVMRDSRPQTGIDFIPTTDTISWLSRCLVGILARPLDMESVKYVWEVHGYDGVTVATLEGDSVLICFPSEDGLSRFRQEDPAWVKYWFKIINPWERNEQIKNRRCWISIRGIPLIAWCKEFFELIGSGFGQFLRVDTETEQKKRLCEARIEVLTTQGSQINKVLEVQIANTGYTLHVHEIQTVNCPCAVMQDEESESLESDDQQDSSSEKAKDGGLRTPDGENSEDGKSEEEEVMGLEDALIMGDVNKNGKSGINAFVFANQHTQSASRGVVNAVVTATTSKFLPISNSFSPLVDHAESGPHEGANSGMGSNANMGPKASTILPSPDHNMATNLSLKTYSSETSPSLSESTSGSRCNIQKAHGSSDAAYVKFLEQRLAKAIQSGRVHRGRRFKKVKASGSVTSAESMHSDIRRVNLRLSQQMVTQNQGVSFTEVEAQETVEMGDILG